MTEPKTVLYNLGEQVQSPDANRAGRLAGRAALDPYFGLLAGNDLATYPPLSFVREGLGAVPGGGLSVDLSDGELLLYDPTILITADPSRYQLGILQGGPLNVPLAGADPGNPRIDLVHAAPTTVDEDSQSRPVKDTTTFVVSNQNINKTRRPGLDVAVVTGVAGATPAFPAVPVGRVALWYVYVPAAAAAVDPDHLMDVRRYVRTNDVRQAGSQLTSPVLITGSPNPTLTPGLATIRGGGYASILSQQIYTLTDVIEPGDPNPPDLNSELHFYLTAAGHGVPVGSTRPNGAVIIASTTAPGDDGAPSVGVAYFPLLGLGLTNVQFTSQDLVYIGSRHTSSVAGNLVTDGGGMPLKRSGDSSALRVIDDSGRSPLFSGFVARPRLDWVSASTVRLKDGWAAYIFGEPTRSRVGNITFDMADPTILIPVEAVSTWYYCYLRWGGTANGKRSRPAEIVPIISDAAPDELGRITGGAEAGFVPSDYIFVGSFYNDAASDIVPYFRDGDRVLFQERIAGAPFETILSPPLASPGLSPVTLVMPGSSRRGIVHAKLFLRADVGTTEQVTVQIHNQALANPLYTCPIEVESEAATTVDINGNQILEVRTLASQFNVSEVGFSGAGAAALSVTLTQIGYYEDVTAPEA